MTERVIRGRVANPECDGRLKANKDKPRITAGTLADRQPGGQGRVKHPKTDKRLAENKYILYGEPSED